MAKTVLVVDDDPTQRRLVQAVLDREGYNVVHAENGGEAIDRMTKGGGADVVLLDMVMPGLSGMETLAEMRTAGVRAPVIILTASGGIDTVVKAMQAGAQDFFIKPASPERIVVGIRNALQMGDLTAEVGRVKRQVSGRTSFDDLVGDSAPMRMVKSLGARREDIPALIDHFIARFNAEEGKRVAGAAPDTLALLTAFEWPGNVRQLENAVYRAIVLADGPWLQPHDFPAISGVAAPMPEAQAASDAPAAEHALSDLSLPDAPVRIIDDKGHLRTLEDIERDLIQHAIEVYAGHMSEIARRLGIGRSTLYRKVREQGLEDVLKHAG